MTQSRTSYLKSKGQRLRCHKVKSLGFRGNEGYIVCKGIKSSVRFVGTSIPRIIIKVYDNIDPNDVLLLSAAEIRKGNRNFLVMKKGDRTSSNDLKLNFVRLRKNLYQVILPAGLAAGEYAVIGAAESVQGKLKLPCFGI